jgi:hypothetical protein
MFSAVKGEQSMSQPPVVRKAPSNFVSAAASASVAPTPVFELHIRPLFRSLDREHMSFAFNLWQYPEGPGSDPITFFTLILNRLKASAPDVVMPPPYAGGPWPTEWIDLFERWLAAGAPRLELALLDPSHLLAVREPGTLLVRLDASVILPSPGYVAWFERRFADDRQFSPELADEFIVYQRSLAVVSPASTTSNVQDYFELAGTIASVKVVGSNGTFNLTVT